MSISISDLFRCDKGLFFSFSPRRRARNAKKTQKNFHDLLMGFQDQACVAATHRNTCFMRSLVFVLSGGARGDWTFVRIIFGAHSTHNLLCTHIFVHVFICRIGCWKEGCGNDGVRKRLLLSEGQKPLMSIRQKLLLHDLFSVSDTTNISTRWMTVGGGWLNLVSGVLFYWLVILGWRIGRCGKMYMRERQKNCRLENSARFQCDPKVNW